MPDHRTIMAASGMGHGDPLSAQLQMHMLNGEAANRQKLNPVEGPWGHQPPTMAKEFVHHQIGEAYGNKQGGEKHGELLTALEDLNDKPGMHVQRMLGRLHDRGSYNEFSGTHLTPEAHSQLFHPGEKHARNHQPVYAMLVRKGPYAGNDYQYHPSTGWHVHGGADVPRKIHTLPGDLHDTFMQHLPVLSSKVDSHLKGQ